MMSYDEQLNTYEWRERRAQIIRRDWHQCTKCKSTLNLNVHHKQYIEGKMAWDYPDSVLVTLCKNCHEKEHNIDNECPYEKSGQIIKSAVEGIVGLMIREAQNG